jgi:hypothetical protein
MVNNSTNNVEGTHDKADMVAFLAIVKQAIAATPRYRLTGAMNGTLSSKIWLTLAVKRDSNEAIVRRIWNSLPRRGFLGLSTIRHLTSDDVNWTTVLGCNYVTVTNVAVINPDDMLGIAGGDEWILSYTVKRRDGMQPS